MRNNDFKLLILFTLASLLIFVTGCSNNDIANGNSSIKDEVNDTSISSQIDKDQTIEELKTNLLTEVENEISKLESEWDSLKNEINTYEKYVKNTDRVKDFYRSIISHAE